MALLIDGYNLLYASGILGRGRGPGYLERSRQALLNFLVESLDERAVARCQVVFDASIENAPRGAPRRLSHRGITVHFAAGLPSADELIEQLILADNSPKQLTVVSSDHRLHRAAKRRKATPIDSDIWFFQTLRDRAARHEASESESAKPDAPSSAFETNFWLKTFGFERDLGEGETRKDPPPIANPFPEGYADDLVEDEM